MSSDSEKPAEHEEVVSTPASADQVGSESGFNAGMVALGGFVLIGTYLVFGLLLNDYWVGWLALLLAVVAVGALASYVGYALAFVGARSIKT